MVFEQWYEKEGSLMAESGCSYEVIAKAAWSACKGSSLKLIDDELNDGTITNSDLEYIALDQLRDKVEDEI